LVLPLRLTNDVGDHDGEGSVAATCEHGSIAPLDKRPRDVPPFLDASRDEEVACHQALIERIDDFVIHALRIAIDDNGNALTRRRDAGRLPLGRRGDRRGAVHDAASLPRGTTSASISSVQTSDELDVALDNLVRQLSFW